jgi:uncharacterized cupin superfamily protein
MIARLSIPGAWMWSAWQPDRGIHFNSYAFERASAEDRAGCVVIDPLPLDENDFQRIASFGGVHTIVITNPDHQRACQLFRERFASRVIDVPADGDELFAGAYAVDIPHGKAPEFAVHLALEKTAVVGDALLGTPAGALSVVADEKLSHPERFTMALRRLWALELDSLLLCDGQPLFSGADDALAKLLEARGGPAVNRINLEELTFEKYKAHGRFGADDAEVGLLIGARKLGYRVARIEPGNSFCPLHSHESEEEFFFVLDGEPSIRTLRGTLRCRRGDFIAFPTGEGGTHELRNDSSAPCTVLLVGLNNPAEICFYPDSDKVLVDVRGSRRLMVRSSPPLAYFDGE